MHGFGYMGNGLPLCERKEKREINLGHELTLLQREETDRDRLSIERLETEHKTEKTRKSSGSSSCTNYSPLQRRIGPHGYHPPSQAQYPPRMAHNPPRSRRG
jgi:hypothetical protein